MTVYFFSLWFAMWVGRGVGTTVPYKKYGKVLVSKVAIADGKTLKGNIFKSVELLGGFGKVIEEGDEVLLKPNFNTGDAPPGSSDPDFVKAIIELLYAHGASKVILGESSSWLGIRNKNIKAQSNKRALFT